MREIKFRAWHFGQNRMFSAEEMTKDQMALLPDGHFANISGEQLEKTVVYPHETMLPLQFTGLKDCKGREIYEGDILRYTESVWNVDSPPTYSLKTRIIVVDEASDLANDFNDTFGWNIPYSDNIEVVGNKFENPELLEESNG